MPMIPVHPGGNKPDVSDWRVQLLTAIHAPVNATNLTALQAWALSESGYNSEWGTNQAGPPGVGPTGPYGGYNPLAITDSWGVPTTGDINSDGVKQFASTQAGVEATVRFFQHGYTPVIDALRSSDPVALYQAVNQSGWCRGCQSGLYPVDLHGYLSGQQIQGGSSTFKGSFGGIGAGGTNSPGGGSPGASGSDSGGLFGTCNITTEKGIFGIGGGIPTGGFGCYIEKSFIFGGLAVGGSVIMLVGLGLAVAPGFASKIGIGDLVALGAGLGSRLQGVGAKTESVSMKPPAQESGPSRAQERAEEAHRHRMNLARAKTRQERAKAREAELRAPTGRQRVAAAGRGETRAAGPVAGGSLAFETPGVAA